MAHYNLFFDGSCWPNPSNSGAFGYALFKEGHDGPFKIGHGVFGGRGDITNNVAEFHALDQGLGAFISCHEAPGRIHALQVYGDSKLVINVMNGHWKARPERAYYDTYLVARANLGIIRRAGHVVTFDWIPREDNTRCDDLSKAHQKTEK